MTEIVPTPTIQKDAQPYKQDFKAPVKIQEGFAEILAKKIKEINK